MTSDPWTGARLGINTDSPLGGSYLAEVVNEVGKWICPAFSSTAARDSALVTWVANGNTVSDGMRCTCAGVPYRRLGGTWRIEGTTIGGRSYTPAGSGITNGGNRQSGTGADPAVASITLIQAARVKLDTVFRVGVQVANTGAALFYMLVDGTQIANGVKRSTDETTSLTGWVDLAAGTHTIALRVEAFAGDVFWFGSVMTMVVGVTE